RATVTTDLTENYARAARTALDAMNKFDKFLKNSLLARSDYNWRLGNFYSRRFHLAMAAGVEADDTLQSAERQLSAVRARMLDLARPLHASLAPAHKDHAELDEEGRVNPIGGGGRAGNAENQSTAESITGHATQGPDAD